jgi:hypothetical protein
MQLNVMVINEEALKVYKNINGLKVLVEKILEKVINLAFINKINTSKSISGTLEAPYVPNLELNIDSSNFDKYPEETGKEPDDDVSGWEIGF